LFLIKIVFAFREIPEKKNNTMKNILTIVFM
jgi:hypothetical protein